MIRLAVVLALALLPYYTVNLLIIPPDKHETCNANMQTWISVLSLDFVSVSIQWHEEQITGTDTLNFINQRQNTLLSSRIKLRSYVQELFTLPKIFYSNTI